jgi:hypothetical protein
VGGGAAVKGEWREAVKKAKAKPAGRHSHTAVAWRDSMFVFGGATADPSGVPSGQLLEFNFRTPPLPVSLCMLLHTNTNANEPQQGRRRGQR